MQNPVQTYFSSLKICQTTSYGGAHSLSPLAFSVRSHDAFDSRTDQEGSAALHSGWQEHLVRQRVGVLVVSSSKHIIYWSPAHSEIC